MSRPRTLVSNVDKRGQALFYQNYGRDCTNDQFLREFVQNSIEAIERSIKKGKQKSGIIEVDYDHYTYEFSQPSRLFKLSISDNGDGIPRSQMERLVNNLSASGFQNTFRNYGLGAKVSSFSRNHEGIWYRSWQDSLGYTATVWFDPIKEVYGLKPFEQPDGRVEYVRDYDDSLFKPDLIKEHGTQVVLLGNSPEQDTMEKPSGVSGSRESWLMYYLNQRFIEIPKEITIKTRIGYHRERSDTRHNYMGVVKGQRATLEDAKAASGVVTISDAEVMWWILDENRSDGHHREYTLGHTAILHSNEILERADSRSNRIRDFGVPIGAKNVVIYVKPNLSRFRQTSSRTGVTEDDGSQLPWQRWAEEFTDQFPSELREYVEGLKARTPQRSHTDEIRKLLLQTRHLYQMQFVRHAPTALTRGDVATTGETVPGSELTRHRKSEDSKKPRGEGPSLDELMQLSQKTGSTPYTGETSFAMPKVNWLSEADGNRQGELEDRAAKFDENDFTIYANRDFQGFREFIVLAAEQYPDAELEVVKESCEFYFELQLTEAVIGILNLKKRPEWTPHDIEKALSEESLTASIMQKILPLQAIRGHIGSHYRKK